MERKPRQGEEGLRWLSALLVQRDCPLRHRHQDRRQLWRIRRHQDQRRPVTANEVRDPKGSPQAIASGALFYL